MFAVDWLKQAQAKLESVEITTARLDSFVLLEDEIGRDRGWLLAHPEFVLTVNQLSRLNKKIIQRSKHTPLAYIRGFTEFYGHRFIVSPAVLEPRPESETMITMLSTLLPGLERSLQRNIFLADVGTGSGALGITAKTEFQCLNVTLIDISTAALKIAKKNVINFATQISVIKGDLLLHAPRDYDVLLCNLPYVPDEYEVNQAVLAEPSVAIFGGSDGLNVYRRLFNQLQNAPQKPLYILTESMNFQHQNLTKIAKNAGFKLLTTDDFIQLFTPITTT